VVSPHTIGRRPTNSLPRLRLPLGRIVPLVETSQSQRARATHAREPLTLTLGHLYPDELNIYGDRGNIITLSQRCAWRGITLRVVPLGLGDVLAPDAYDLLFIGGGQDKEQDEVALDLRETKSSGLWAAVEDGMPVLAVCGGYQLLARSYRPAEGPVLQGIGIFDAETVHRGKRVARCVGNIAIRWEESTIVGFENHGGRTYLGTGARPLGQVLVGHGNNSEDHTEGAVYHHAIGTYIHGSLLPKNPHVADNLLLLALSRRYGPGVTLAPLDDTLEWQAHETILRRLGVAPLPHPALPQALPSHHVVPTSALIPPAPGQDSLH
jgi:lipid II isoglutaminyl synthase (glutamine-hydrolysing)